MKTAMERIHSNAIPAFNNLTDNQQKAITEFLEANPGQTVYDQNDLIEAYLSWNGIINYASSLTLFFKNVLKA